MSELDGRYPWTFTTPAGDVVIDRMKTEDEADVLAMFQRMPEHDLLFLRQKATEPEVVAGWSASVQAGDTLSLIARLDGRVVGLNAVVCDRLAWSSHVGDLRVVVDPEARASGLGRQLLQESFLMAMDAGLSKVTARMTGDQMAAIRIFEDIGFVTEGLLHDHVEDAQGVRHDLQVMACNVDDLNAGIEAWGIDQEF